MRHREYISPDLTPLIDVVFLILIFFMVSSSFVKDELALLLNLPKLESSSSEIKRKDIYIELSKSKIALKGKTLTFVEIDELLKSVKDKKTPVNIRIDEEVKYKRIMKLLDLLNKYELNNLALENKHKE